MKENAVTLVYNDYEVRVRKSSVFSLQSQPAQLKVYHGEAAVAYQTDLVTVKAGHLLPFGAALAMEKFDSKLGDELTRWSQRRGEAVAAANISSAKSLKDSGASWNSSGWFYNPYYSMYTYLPLSGTVWSPYGYGFFSPYTVYNYLPYRNGYGGGGSTYAATRHTGDSSGNFGRAAGFDASSSGGGFGRSSNSGMSGGVVASSSAPSASAGSFSSGAAHSSAGSGGGRGTK